MDATSRTSLLTRRARSQPLRAAGALAALALAACQISGPQAIETGRSAYNMAAQQTANEQLLLNLVRLKYRDTPFFLELTSITTSYQFRSQGTAGGAIGREATDTLGLSATLSFTENPTVSYLPLQGDQFVRQLLSPVELRTLLLLYHSGWRIDRILRVCSQRLNDLENAPAASGPTPSRIPRFRRFAEVTRALRALQERGSLDLAFAKTEEIGVPAELEMRVPPEELQSVEVRRISELLGVVPIDGRFRIGPSLVDGDDARLTVLPRSLMATLFYVSQSVEVPQRDLDAGRVTVTRDDAGEPFDWRELTGDLIRIRTSFAPPENAYVAVQYRNAWFYLDDSDLNSKSTFALLTQLFALQAGEIQNNAPVLTLPVSQ